MKEGIMCERINECALSQHQPVYIYMYICISMYMHLHIHLLSYTPIKSTRGTNIRTKEIAVLN